MKIGDYITSDDWYSLSDHERESLLNYLSFVYGTTVSLSRIWESVYERADRIVILNQHKDLSFRDVSLRHHFNNQVSMEEIRRMVKLGESM